MPTITHAEAVTRAKKIAEVCGANAVATEKLRHLPTENVQAIVESDLIGLIIPKDRGGYGIDSWMMIADVVAEVGRVCGASGWCFDLLMQHHWVFGMFPGEAQDHVFKNDKRPKIATSFMPAGKVTRAPGGYRVTGDWSFSSGVNHCDWGIFGAVVPPADASGHPDLRFFLFGPGEFEVKDTWNSMGLRGSGSNNAVVKDVFVREEHSIRAAEFAAGTTPGTKINPGVMFREPGYVAFPFGIFCPLIAMAHGAMDSFTNFSKTRAAGPARDPVLQMYNTQRSIGESGAEIEAAYLLAKANDERLMNGMPLTETDVVTIRRNFTFASRLAMRAVDRLMETSGARGIMDSNPLQRFWRDIHAAGNHIAFAVDSSYITAGAHAMGVPVPGAH